MAEDSKIEPSSISNNLFYRFTVPLITTTLGQIIVGPFVGIKADMQNNPSLTMRQAFAQRYQMNNPDKVFNIGISNIYKGNFWNYVYTLGCSITGNNLLQIVRYSNSYTNNPIIQVFSGGILAGCIESAWTAPIVARELNKTTASNLLSLKATYTRLYPSLALRDSIGWIVIQANAILMDKLAKRMDDPRGLLTLPMFCLSGLMAALLTAPADANLRRLYSDYSNKGPTTIFRESCQKHGVFATTFAGWQARLAVVSPPFMAYSIAQHYLSKNMSTPDKALAYLA